MCIFIWVKYSVHPRMTLFAKVWTIPEPSSGVPPYSFLARSIRSSINAERVTSVRPSLWKWRKTPLLSWTIIRKAHDSSSQCENRMPICLISLMLLWVFGNFVFQIVGISRKFPTRELDPQRRKVVYICQFRRLLQSLLDASLRRSVVLMLSVLSRRLLTPARNNHPPR